jgi:hypothetical protein
MTRTRINLVTLSDVNRFVETMSNIDAAVWLEDDDGSRVNAKSVLGTIYSLEWRRIYCYCEKDISLHLMPWII